jgi:hypothetical protein
MLVIWTPKRPPRGRRALVPRSCNILVLLRLCQPSWAPRMRDLPRSVCSCSPASLLWTPRILCRNEGLPRGCAPDGPAKYFWVLGRYTLETFLRSACLEWLRQTLCSYARYLGVSTPHMFKVNGFLVSSSTKPRHRNFSYDVIDAPFKTLLGILGYWALLI